MKNTPATEEFERCVVCGGLTDVPVSVPIDFREDYEVGCGQLCASCKYELRQSTEKENEPTYNQTMMVVEQNRENTG